MHRSNRRGLLRGVGCLALGVAGVDVGPGRARASTHTPSLAPLGHSLLGNPAMEFAEGVVRADGRYALLGGWRGADRGTLLVDLADPASPERVHHLPMAGELMPMDVGFDGRDGLYYRVEEPEGDATAVGVEVVDYGYADGSPAEPTVIGRLDAGPTHNLDAHPGAPILYTVNHDADGGSRGLEVWDVADPAAPAKLTEVGRPGPLHDVSVDAHRDRLHCAYGGGYVLMDASDPAAPSELGAFDYDGRPTYEEAGLGNPGFAFGHTARADPRRDLVVVGDEVNRGVPGGKHVLDIGWGEGSPAAPVHVGFTTSPNATVQAPDDGGWGTVLRDWTGHNFDLVPWGEATLLVSGDWHEGVVCYDLTDPTDPTPIDRYATDDRAGEAAGPGRWGPPPYAWSATYNAARDLVVASDVVTGVYTFRVDGARPTPAGGGGPGTEPPASTPDATPPSTDRGDGSERDSILDVDGDGSVGVDDVVALLSRLLG